MKKRILIIDDDQYILEILNVVLEQEGYVVILCNSGAAAERLETINPDLILLDIRITGAAKTGAEICTELKSQDSFCKIPIILLSAELNIETLARDCGSDSYIRKPFDIDELINCINDFVDKS